ncbi:hypothetical protein G6F62_013433 [Rhizopus arrhizus]|nr:hypothetical protein G6F62_013433 [Rhizopus arrhizus]
MLGQPGFQRPLLLHVFLQFHQRRQAGFQACQVLHVGLGGGLGAAALGIRFGHAAFQRGQFFLGFFQLVFACQAVAGQLLQAHRVRSVQFTQFLLQAFAALLQDLHLAVGVALGLEADQVVGIQRGEQPQVIGHGLQQVGRGHRDVQEEADAAADAAFAQQRTERDQVVVVDPDDVVSRVPRS